MSAASEPVMDAVEKVAQTVAHAECCDFVGSDEDGKEYYRIVARALIAAFPQLALEGREERGTAPVLGEPSDMTDVTRTVWESPWSEVQS